MSIIWDSYRLLHGHYAIDTVLHGQDCMEGGASSIYASIVGCPSLGKLWDSAVLYIERLPSIWINATL
ncbi:hypothetical protein MA16_Dca004115 [Dendrobium catenatum]|uniref:Uncharacterized protein n=1 Tax=Dendrobium catenatum TaxID=906689 RepID=A0A2I0X2F0_9ASPA|nr:hypothetical protein MA16_Dca004115 [Dendrobium catenatum]